MKLDLLIDIQLLSEFNKDAVDCIEVITIISTCGGEVQDDEVVALLVFL